MQLTLFDLTLEDSHQLSSGKTCQECYEPKTTPSDVSWQNLLDRTFPSKSSQANGLVQVWCPVQSAKSRGVPSMLNISECPNVAVESSLSQVLEQISPPPRYFLSVRACQGILRRAEIRKKTLPPILLKALESSIQSGGGQTERLAIDKTVPTILANCGTKQWLGNQEAFAGKHYIYERKVYDMSHPCDVIRTSEQVPTLKARMGTGGNQVPLVLDKEEK